MLVMALHISEEMGNISMNINPKKRSYLWEQYVYSIQHNKK